MAAESSRHNRSGECTGSLLSIALGSLLLISLSIASCTILSDIGITSGVLPSVADSLGTAVPYELPEQWSGGVVLVELFTYYESDVRRLAIDELMFRYPGSILGVLQYHQHQGRIIDPLTNPSSLNRASYYFLSWPPTVRIVDSEGVPDYVSWRPTVFVDGRKMPIGLDFETEKNIWNHYRIYRRAIEKDLRLIPPVTIDLEVERDGSILDISASVEQVIDLTGFKLWLHIALAEKEITLSRYSDRPDVFDMVVRYMMGDGYGRLVEFEGGSFTVRERIYLEEVEKEIYAYLTGDVVRMAGVDFEYNSVPGVGDIDPDNLVVIAFIQRDHDKLILQSAVVDLSEGGVL